MASYQTKASILPGTNLSEAYRQARLVFRPLQKRTKRTPYVRSAHFDKRKVFFNIFWQHLEQKNPRDRYLRLKLLAAAIELIQHTRIKPTTKINPNRPTERLHRFTGTTRDGQEFYVQIKENVRTKRLHLLSTFPERK